MTQAGDGGDARTWQVGVDSVRRQGEKLLVDAASPMDDWTPRKYRRLAIYFDGARYYVSGARSTPSGRWAYVLSPWDEIGMDVPAGEVRYDEELVREREERLELERTAVRRSRLLTPLSPLIGFLPSRTKGVFHERYGIDARVATRRSLYVEYALLVLAGPFLIITMVTGIFSPLKLVALIFFIAPDTLVRYSDLMKGGMSPYGFYEWLFRLKWK